MEKGPSFKLFATQKSPVKESVTLLQNVVTAEVSELNSLQGIKTLQDVREKSKQNNYPLAVVLIIAMRQESFDPREAWYEVYNNTELHQIYATLAKEGLMTPDLWTLYNIVLETLIYQEINGDCIKTLVEKFRFNDNPEGLKFAELLTEYFIGPEKEIDDPLTFATFSRYTR